MKKLILVIVLQLCFVAFIFSQVNSTSRPFTLAGKITGETTGRLVLKYMNVNKAIYDTAIVKNGNFIFRGEIIEPTGAYLDDLNSRNSVHLFLEPGALKIILDKSNFENFQMTGSKTQDERMELNKLEKDLKSQMNTIYDEKQAIRADIGKTKDKERIKQLEKDLEEKSNQKEKLEKQVRMIELDYIQSHPKSHLSTYLLSFFDANEEISLDSLKLIYGKLDSVVQQSLTGNRIKKNIKKKENNRVGAFVPDFKAKDLNDKVVTYSQFKGENVVLFDFWASWCGPCRAAFSHVKKLYQRYHSEGLEVIAVSSDLKKDAWIKAVKNDSIENWHHVPIAERYAEGPAFITDDDIYNNYFVVAIPVQILVNKDGKVVGRWLGYSEENERDLDKKMAELFNE